MDTRTHDVSFNTLAGYVLKLYLSMFISIELFRLNLFYIATYISAKSRHSKRVASNYKEKSMLKNPVVSLRYHLLISTAGVQGATSYIYHAYTSYIHIYCLEFYN